MASATETARPASASASKAPRTPATRESPGPLKSADRAPPVRRNRAGRPHRTPHQGRRPTCRTFGPRWQDRLRTHDQIGHRLPGSRISHTTVSTTGVARLRAGIPARQRAGMPARPSARSGTRFVVSAGHRTGWRTGRRMRMSPRDLVQLLVRQIDEHPLLEPELLLWRSRIRLDLHSSSPFRDFHGFKRLHRGPTRWGRPSAKPGLFD